jgi:purine-binding chemotaxis protein CheW
MHRLIVSPTREGQYRVAHVEAPINQLRSSFLVCDLGSYLCGLSLTYVTETMRPLPVNTLVGAPSFVLGMAIIRANAVPVVDVAQVLGGEQADAGRFVLIKVNERAVALAVATILGIRTISDESLHQLPPLLDGAGGEVIAELARLDSEMLVVLETSRLLPGATWELVDRKVVE